MGVSHKADTAEEGETRAIGRWWRAPLPYNSNLFRKENVLERYRDVTRTRADHHKCLPPPPRMPKSNASIILKKE